MITPGLLALTSDTKNTVCQTIFMIDRAERAVKTLL
jgi:hypothetical protein